MKYITFYTDTHKILLDKYFLPSFHKIKQENDTIHVAYNKQYECDGSYYNNDFGKICNDKIKHIIDFMNNSVDFGEFFIYSDCDVIFNKSPNLLIDGVDKSIDLIVQNDIGSHGAVLCAGFMAIRKTKNSINFFNKIMQETKNFEHDQYCINFYKNEINYSFFQHSQIFNIVDLINRNAIVGDIPNNIFDNSNLKNVCVFHANWVVGVLNKMKLMDLFILKNENPYI